jgi:sulfur carrier protein ThiS
MLNVRIGTMPGRINEFALENGATVKEALEIADLTTEGYQIKVNGEQVDEEKVLSDGDLVLLVKQIKGNLEPIVRVGTMPGRINEYAVSAGATVEDVLEIADLTTEGYQIKVNGEMATLDTPVNDGDLVLLVKQIKGN